MLLVVIFLIQIILIYRISHETQRIFFRIFHQLTKSYKATAYCISLLYFPGIVIHELSHFIAAAALFLDVRDISLIPKTHEVGQGHIGFELGSVTYVKKDPFRGLLVGIAPFFCGLLVFYALFQSQIFPSSTLWINVVVLYFIFVVSSTMFSSSQDLKDLLYVSPVLIVLLLLLWYKSDAVVEFLSKDRIQDTLGNFFNEFNRYLFFSLIVNILLYTPMKILFRNKR